MTIAEVEAHRVVVVGGGFRGLQATLGLRRAPVQITLVDRRNFHLFQPLTYQIATGALSPGEVAHPLRTIFKRGPLGSRAQLVVDDALGPPGGRCRSGRRAARAVAAASCGVPAGYRSGSRARGT